MAKYNDREGMQVACDLDLSEATVPARAAGDTGPLLIQEFRDTIAFGDLGSGATDAIALSGFPANALILGAAIEVDDAWTVGGGDTTGLTAELGDAGVTDEQLAALDLVGVSAGWAAHAPGSKSSRFESAWSPEVLFTATGGSTELDHVDAGALTVHIWYALPNLAS